MYYTTRDSFWHLMLSSQNNESDTNY